MTTFSRETELSFHRKAAEQEARLVADLERILWMFVTNRKHYDEIQERLLDELQHRLERRHYSEEEISEAVSRYRQECREAGYEEGY